MGRREDRATVDECRCGAGERRLAHDRQLRPERQDRRHHPGVHPAARPRRRRPAGLHAVRRRPRPALRPQRPRPVRPAQLDDRPGHRHPARPPDHAAGRPRPVRPGPPVARSASAVRAVAGGHARASCSASRRSRRTTSARCARPASRWSAARWTRSPTPGRSRSRRPRSGGSRSSTSPSAATASWRTPPRATTGWPRSPTAGSPASCRGASSSACPHRRSRRSTSTWRPPSPPCRRWRAGAEPVTAVAAYNDEVALAVLSGLRAEGLRTPQDVAVIGVDDIPAARLAAPALTTIWQAIDAQARYLADAVLAALDDTRRAACPAGRRLPRHRPRLDVTRRGPAAWRCCRAAAVVR